MDNLHKTFSGETRKIMIVVISPSKTLDCETPVIVKKHSIPELLAYSCQLVEQCRKLNSADISVLMKVSEKIADLNVKRFAAWNSAFTAVNAKQAILVFKGDVYSGLDVDTFSDLDFDFAQSKLRILSGLYGVLRPLDLMKPYRLEMGVKLNNPRGKNLYHFWGDIITEKLNEVVATLKEKVLVNLASSEYAKSINTDKFQGQIITPVFKEYKNGVYKVIGLHAKRARGLMARHIIKNQIMDLKQLTEFNTGGYLFSAPDSSDTKLTFYRDNRL